RLLKLKLGPADKSGLCCIDLASLIGEGPGLMIIAHAQPQERNFDESRIIVIGAFEPVITLERLPIPILEVIAFEPEEIEQIKIEIGTSNIARIGFLFLLVLPVRHGVLGSELTVF